jgi:hypothetical protein
MAKFVDQVEGVDEGFVPQILVGSVAFHQGLSAQLNPFIGPILILPHSLPQEKSGSSVDLII